MAAPRFDWVRSVMLPVIGVAAGIGFGLGAAVGWPEDWSSPAAWNAFWGWACGMAIALGLTAYAATGFVGLARWWLEA